MFHQADLKCPNGQVFSTVVSDRHTGAFYKIPGEVGKELSLVQETGTGTYIGYRSCNDGPDDFALCWDEQRSDFVVQVIVPGSGTRTGRTKSISLKKLVALVDAATS